MQNFSIKYKVIRLISLIIPLVIMAMSVGNVFAIEFSGFGGRPANPRSDNPRSDSIFVHTLSPGDVKKEGVIVINNSTEKKKILIYAVDSTPSTDGAFACAQASADRAGVGSWINLEKSEVTLKPGLTEVVPFTITVPQNTEVGEHNGCVVTQAKIEDTKEKSGVNLSFRTGLRVAITIPGNIVRELKITDFYVIKRGDGSVLLHPEVKNLGNVSIDADVRVSTKSFLGFSVNEQGGEFPILRGDTSAWNFELKKPFWGGWYRSSVVVEYDKSLKASIGIESGQELTRLQGPTRWFFTFPSAVGLLIESGILLLFAFIVFLTWLKRKRKTWIKNDWVGYRVKLGDNVKLVAAKHSVSWRLIAKANKLKPPYTIKTGKKIKVPPKEK